MRVTTFLVGWFAHHRFVAVETWRIRREAAVIRHPVRLAGIGYVGYTRYEMELSIGSSDRCNRLNRRIICRGRVKTVQRGGQFVFAVVDELIDVALPRVGELCP